MKNLLRPGILMLITLFLFLLTIGSKPVFAQQEIPWLLRIPVTVKPYDIAVQTSSQGWFTAPDANLIGKVQIVSQAPFSATVQTFSPPTAGSRPYSIAYHDGYVWFTQKDSASIGRLDIDDGVIEEYPIPTIGSQPTGIAVAPDGTVWFTENNTGKLGRVNPANGVITEIAFANPAAGFTDIQVAGTGRVYALATGIGAIVEYIPSSGAFRTLTISDPSGHPVGMPRSFTVSNAGGLYVATSNPARIGGFLVGTLEIWLWTDYARTDADLRSLSSTSLGTSMLWAVDLTNAEAARITASTRMIANTVSTEDSETSFFVGITVDGATGTAWLAEEGQNAIVLWKQPYGYLSYVPAVFRDSGVR